MLMLHYSHFSSSPHRLRGNHLFGFTGSTRFLNEEDEEKKKKKEQRHRYFQLVVISLCFDVRFELSSLRRFLSFLASMIMDGFAFLTSFDTDLAFDLPFDVKDVLSKCPNYYSLRSVPE